MHNDPLSWAQLIGYAALIIYVGAYLCRDDNRLKIAFSISNLFWIVHYYLIAAHTAALTTLIVTIRNMLSLNAQDMPDDKKKIMAGVFTLILLGAGLVTWAGWVSVIPVAACVIATYAVFYLKDINLRLVFFSIDAGWMAHAIAVGSYSGLVYAVGAMAVNAYTIWKMKEQKS